MRKNAFAVAACGLLLAASAHSATYVLHAGSWGAAQDRAVALAGGQVKFRHAKSGVAVVESEQPGFLAAALRSSAIAGGSLDQVVQWTDPVAVVEAPELQTVNPTNDTYYGIQWAPGAIEAPAAWAAGYTGAGVRVAIIDGGLHATHPDLAANVDVGASRSFVAPDPEATPAENACRTAFNCDLGTFWHGTHVAGIVAARDNSIGVVGIAPDATLVGVKALHGGSGSFGAVIAAILYAAGEAQADIINMSLGAVFPKNAEGASELRNALAKAVKAASETALVVVATGNDALSFDGNNLTTVPAESGPAMAISATGPFGWAYGATDYARLASYSNYGHSLVSIGAPGGDFAWPTEELCGVTIPAGTLVNFCWVFDMVISTARGANPNPMSGSYSWAAGTSMAAPAASAVAALVKQKHPDMSPKALRKHLEKTSVDVGKNNTATHGAGFLNARRAVD